MPFPADLAGPVTVGVTDLADAGILFQTDYAGNVTSDVVSLAVADLVTVGVADLTVAGAAPLAVSDVITELELVTMKVTDEVDEFPVHYGGSYDGFRGPGFTDVGYFDDQSEYYDHQDYREWDDWCNIDIHDGSYDPFPEDGEAWCFVKDAYCSLCFPWWIG